MILSHKPENKDLKLDTDPGIPAGALFPILKQTEKPPSVSHQKSSAITPFHRKDRSGRAFFVVFRCRYSDQKHFRNRNHRWLLRGFSILFCRFSVTARFKLKKKAEKNRTDSGIQAFLTAFCTEKQVRKTWKKCENHTLFFFYSDNKNQDGSRCRKKAVITMSYLRQTLNRPMIRNGQQMKPVTWSLGILLEKSKVRHSLVKRFTHISGNKPE